MATSCYVHVPFCDSICSYCDFSRTIASASIKEKWLNQICKEIQNYGVEKISTLYFGGGTPSSLSVAQIERLGECFQDFAEGYEWTIECNPESVTQEKIQTYVKLGMNRVSLGVQSFNDSLLVSIGRKHTKETILNAIDCIRNNGISNISIDLIYALPNQTLEDVRFDLELFLSLDLPHLSIYSLQIEENSIFGRQNLQPIDPDLEADMYDLICDTLKEAGYEHYEISSFCKPNMYSRHNLTYWTDQDFIGFGCGASGREHGVRYDNDSSLRTYIEEGVCRVEQETDAPFEAIMMGLRTSFGVDLIQFEQRYGFKVEEKYAHVLAKYSEQLFIQDSHLKCNEYGFHILNTILIDFLE